MYEVLIERGAERDIGNLQKIEISKIIVRIRALSGDPRPHGCKKITGSLSDWRIRIGDYRVLYEINDKKKVVKIMKIRHRKEVYR